MKTHFYESTDPAVEGSDLEAICGKPVKKVRFNGKAVVGQEGFELESMNTLMLCRLCIEIAAAPAILDITAEGHVRWQEGTRFLYGIVDGESAKQAERESA